MMFAGSSPLKLLLPRYLYCNEARSLYEFGISPVKLLKLKSLQQRLEKVLSRSGSWPVIRQFLNDNIERLVKFSMKFREESPLLRSPILKSSSFVRAP
nr:hypothetical protein Iba_chr05aCG11440 [Ipomoea batatas]